MMNLPKSPMPPAMNGLKGLSRPKPKMKATRLGRSNLAPQPGAQAGTLSGSMQQNRPF